ncbi:MAG: methyltransferase domain-containing protein [Flavobacterium sp.]|nr:MAG: methyltransferase domain-containing protein [Flavobacterium sp.]
MKKVLDRIWSENAEKFMSVVHTSQKNVLHPTLSKLINTHKPHNLLDFGCGDGRILNEIDAQVEMDVYDKNEEMIHLAKHNVGDKIKTIYSDINEIPNDRYESVLLSMVLVCIDNEDEYLGVLKKIKLCKTEIGKVYIAISHPCFNRRCAVYNCLGRPAYQQGRNDPI